VAEHVIILGSGPAGCTAAIYAARANMEPLVFEAKSGGQLADTTEVDNFPGYPEGVLGPEMMADLKKQAMRFGARFELRTAVAADLSRRPFHVTSDDDTALECEALIIATGARARKMGLESEDQLWGHGVTACATCDGFFFRGREVAVVGGGDTAMEDATFLTRFASKVTIIHRRDELRASKPMQERAMNNPKIDFLWNKVVKEVHDPEQQRVTGLTLEDTQTGEQSEFATQGLFLAIGHDPDTQIFRGQLELDDAGYVIPQTPGRTLTSVDGVFACGDCVDTIYRQAITAAGSGCKAAIDCERWLEAQRK
jgi:thioredoxin reductase (NADPH)